MTSVIVDVSDMPDQQLAGCARGQQRVSVVWSGLESSAQPYRVEIDSGNQIEEGVI